MRSFIQLILCLFLVDVAFSLDKERDCKCRIKSKRRIIGGREAGPMAYPWQVSLQRKEIDPVPDDLRKLVPEKEKIEFHFCGGIIISNSWILTAGHCLWLLTGIMKIYERKLYAEVYNYYQHPKYSDWSLTNDIALIKLKKPLNFTDSVQPICLPAQDQEHYDGTLKISGFGSVENVVRDQDGDRIKGMLSRYLKEGNTYDVSGELREGCLMSEVCVENRKDPSADKTCNGDSGGPLHHTRGGRTAVIGLTSYGSSKKDADGNTVFCSGITYFTRVSYYMDWIKQTIQSNSGDDLCF